MINGVTVPLNAEFVLAIASQPTNTCPLVLVSRNVIEILTCTKHNLAKQVSKLWRGAFTEKKAGKGENRKM